MYYRVAGLTVQMESFGRTVEQAKPYEITPVDKPDIIIESRWPLNKQNHPYFSDSDGEYLSTGACFYRLLLEHGGFMLHASCVVVDGKAYLFSADSGTGKSTHTKMWLDMFGERAYILNDDKPALRVENGIWYAYGTPWSGKHDISVNTRAPIAGIAMIERAFENSITKFSGTEAIAAVLKQSNRPKAMEYRVRLMELLDKLFREVPVWKLKCNMNAEAAQMAYAAMSACGKE